jgi:hypothetical protein
MRDIEVAVWLANQQEIGIVYLGLCGGLCSDVITVEGKSTAFGRCHGRCAHAYGMQKKFAKTFISKAYELHEKYFKPLDVKRLFMDTSLELVCKYTQRAILAGTNFYSPLVGHQDYLKHTGIIFQDREKFHSMISTGDTIRAKRSAPFGKVLAGMSIVGLLAISATYFLRRKNSDLVFA